MKIPPQLQKKEFRFVKIKKGQKGPFERDWPNTANYKWNDPKFKKWAENYGVVCGYGDLVVIDADKKEIEKVVRKRLPNTFTVKSGGKGLPHFYYICKDLKSKRIKENGQSLFDLQFVGTQVVGPGSLHPSGKHYSVLDDKPIAKIKREQLEDALGEFIKIEEPKERKKYPKNRNVDLPITSVISTSGLKEVRRGVYQGPHPIHGCTHPGKGHKAKDCMNFRMDTNSNLWYCFAHKVGGDSFTLLAVKEGLINCSQAGAGALRDKKIFKKVLKIAQEKHGLKLKTEKGESFDGPKSGKHKNCFFEKLYANYRIEIIKINGGYKLNVYNKDDNIAMPPLKLSKHFWLKRKVMQDVVEELVVNDIIKPSMGEKLKSFKGRIGNELSIEIEKKLRKKTEYKKEDDPQKGDLDILKGDIIGKIIQETNKKVVREVDTRKTIICFKAMSLVENCEPTSTNLLLAEESGIGKDYLLKKTLEIFPKESHFHKAKVTPEVLAYWHNGLNENNDNWTWDRKSLHLEEISYNTLNSDTLTGFLSNKNFTGLVLIKQRATELRINGKPSFFITTASKNPKKDMLRRLSMCQLNDSIDQTREIVKRQSKYAEQGESLEYDDKVTKALRKLKTVKVKIPFASKLGKVLLKEIPITNKILRTNYLRYLDIIRGFTALYQYQREEDDEGYLLATYEDYENAIPVLNKITNTSSTIPLTKEKKKIIDIIESFGDGFHEVSKIDSKVTFFSTQTLYKRLKELADDEFLIQDRITRTNTKGYEYKTMAYKTTNMGKFEFPSVKKLETVDSVKSLETVETVDEAPKPSDYTDSTDSTDSTNKTILLSCYPEKEPEEYIKIEERAKELYGIEPEEFYEIHEKLLRMGYIHEPRHGYFKRV